MQDGSIRNAHPMCCASYLTVLKAMLQRMVISRFRLLMFGITIILFKMLSKSSVSRDLISKPLAMNMISISSSLWSCFLMQEYFGKQSAVTGTFTPWRILIFWPTLRCVSAMRLLFSSFTSRECWQTVALWTLLRNSIACKHLMPMRH